MRWSFIPRVETLYEHTKNRQAAVGEVTRCKIDTVAVNLTFYVTTNGTQSQEVLTNFFVGEHIA